MYKKPYHTVSLTDKTFLITGGAGFIGSNLVEYLLKYGARKVRVLDNLSTGKLINIKDFLPNSSFEFVEGDIRDLATCQKACEGIDYISHQAALGSVPRSISDPITTNEVNINGFLNMLISARDVQSKQFVYAASSSTYGDSQELPKVEDKIGKPLSPYAVTKYVNELYADVFSKTYGLTTIGLRYFNVFGPKQDPYGVYAAVIPLFIKAALEKQSPIINGNGRQSRDFTYIENVIQANIKALFATSDAINQVYNVAVGEQTTLLELFEYINEIVGGNVKPILGPNRVGDIQHSLADISKANKLLGYNPEFKITEGLKMTYKWFLVENQA